VIESESLDRAKAAAEFMFMGLRMTRGVSVEDFFRRFGQKPAELYPEIGAWMDEGLMEAERDELRLTRRGLMLADEIFVAFV
jgi:oxygen-independent coproporphyrinogen-3 oxidase